MLAHSSRLMANCGCIQYRSQFVFDLGDGFAVDAMWVSNRIRRVNHASTSPNVRAQVVNHRGVRC